jgi:hypothetical protein
VAWRALPASPRSRTIPSSPDAAPEKHARRAVQTRARGPGPGESSDGWSRWRGIGSLRRGTARDPYIRPMNCALRVVSFNGAGSRLRNVKRLADHQRSRESEGQNHGVEDGTGEEERSERQPVRDPAGLCEDEDQQHQEHAGGDRRPLEVGYLDWKRGSRTVLEMAAGLVLPTGATANRRSRGQAPASSRRTDGGRSRAAACDFEALTGQAAAPRLPGRPDRRSEPGTGRLE